MNRPVDHIQFQNPKTVKNNSGSCSPEPQYFTLAQVANDDVPHTPGVKKDTYRLLADWVKTYLMRPNDQLGRNGSVCPYAAQASQLGALRFTVSSASSNEPEAIYQVMKDSMSVVDEIACEPQMQHLRSIFVAFPNCQDAAGIRALEQVQSRLKYSALRRFKLVGLFHANTAAPGLRNVDFRPLRSPFPLIAIRDITLNDTPFVKRHALMLPVYLFKFPIRGTKRLFAAFFSGKRSKS